MVVKCPECGAKFFLDESRIPGATAKVRCSRCRHVFRLTREGEIVSPEWVPPLEEYPESLPPEEEREAMPPPDVRKAAEPAPVPEKEKAPEAMAPPPPEAAPAAVASAAQKLRRWWWVAASALVLIVALGWWFWPGKFPLGPRQPLTDAVNSQEGKAPPPEPSAPGTQVATPPLPPVPAPDLRELPVEWAQAHYQGLVNDKAGQLLIIQGEVVNKGKNPRGPIRVKAILTDSRHQPLREEIVYAGTTLNDSELKSLDPEEIKAWLQKPGGRSQAQVLKPGQRQPFTVVFFGAPGDLSEKQAGFQIMVVEGSETGARP